MKNLTLRNITKICEGSLCARDDFKKFDVEVENVVLDSEEVEEGDLFIAVKGTQTDGHNYIYRAFERGAVAVMCDKIPEGVEGVYILVEDSHEASRKLAIFWRSQLTLPVIGVIGSVGKTSTKEMIASVLSSKYRVAKTPGSLNGRIGLPMTVLAIRDEHEIAVIEMGIMDFGEMRRFSEIARPDYCVFTNIGDAHLEKLHDRDGVLQAKCEVFEYMDPEGKTVINGDDEKLRLIKDKYQNITTFGRNENNDIVLSKEISQGLKGSIISTKGKRELADIKVLLPGEHMAFNAVAAIAMADVLGLSDEEIIRGFEQVKSVRGRSNFIYKEDYTVIDDCFNANPVSMKTGINLLQLVNGRKIAIIGDMAELGEKSNQFHYEIGAYAVNKVDYLICVGALSQNVYVGAVENKQGSTEVVHLKDKTGVKDIVQKIKKPGDTFWIKASNSMGFTEMVSELVEIL